MTEKVPAEDTALISNDTRQLTDSRDGMRRRMNFLYLMTTGRQMPDDMFAQKKAIVAAGVFAGFAILASPLFLLTNEYSRVTSPDGRFYAVATSPIWQSCIPMMVGQAGDKSGFITVYTAEGDSCGRMPVEMVSYIRDMTWDVIHARAGMAAEWNLLNCRAGDQQ